MPDDTPYKQALWNAWEPSYDATEPSKLVQAYGNTWLLNNQGSTMAGCLTGIFFGVIPNPAPGIGMPGHPVDYTLGAAVDRNFAILSNMTGINFGPVPCQ